jgi:hypothetical protein
VARCDGSRRESLDGVEAFLYWLVAVYLLSILFSMAVTVWVDFFVSVVTQGSKRQVAEQVCQRLVWWQRRTGDAVSGGAGHGRGD